jgi:hypothetical protein
MQASYSHNIVSSQKKSPDTSLSGWKLWLFIFGVALFFVSTIFEFWQYLKPYRWHPSMTVSSQSWWIQPLEWHVDAGLPEIQGNIRAVAASPNGRCLWIGGDSGLLAFSSDDGASWKLLNYNQKNGNLETDQPSPCASAQAASQTSVFPSMLPRVYAAGPEQAQSSQASGMDGKRPANPANQAQQAIPAFPKHFSVAPNATQLEFYLDDAVKHVLIRNTGVESISLRLSLVPGPTSEDFRVLPEICSDVQPNASCSFEIQFKGIEGQPTSSSAVEVFGPAGTAVESKLTEISLTGYPKRLNPPDSNKQPDKTTPATTGTGNPSTTGPNNHSNAGTSNTANTGTSNGSNHSTNGDSTLSRAGNNAPVDAHATPTPVPANPPDILRLEFAGDTGIAITTYGDYRTGDGGKQWGFSFAPKASVLAGLTALVPNTAPPERIGDGPNSTLLPAGHAWAGGALGTLWRKSSSGGAWLPASRAAARVLNGQPVEDPAATSGLYVRFVAPWYLLALLCFGATAVPVLWTPRKAKAQPGAEPVTSDTSKDPPADAASIGNHPVSDKPLEPGEPDALGLGKIASGLSYFLCNENTQPPLVLAVTGRWGSGKSSLMNLLKKELEAGGAHPVWFNAWHHQKEEQLLAALLQAVKAQAVPPLFAFQGIGFRLRLMLKRCRHQWPLLAFMVAGIFLLHRAEVYLRGSHHPPINLWSLVTYLFHFADLSGGAALDSSVPGPVTVVTGLIALYKLLSKLLTAFGANPASLLSSVTGGKNSKDLEAQTSFRERFSREFAEVTGSLATEQRMLIMIDDLDRCRPEKVREVLEAVNFLVSSGNCFVVLGMARDVVEDYLSLSFRHVVDSISWNALGVSQEDIQRAIEETRKNQPLKLRKQIHGTRAKGKQDEAERDIDFEIEAKRRAYAQLFLEKLIQIEVSIPEPTAAQKRVFFAVTAETGDQQAGQKIKLDRMAARLEKARRMVVPVLQLAALTTALIFAGLYSSGWLEQRVNEITAPCDKKTNPECGKPDEQAAALAKIAASLDRLSGKQRDTAGPATAPAAEQAQLSSQEQSRQPARKDESKRKNGANSGGQTVSSRNQQILTPPPAKPQPQIPSISDPRSLLSGWPGTWFFYAILLAEMFVISLVLGKKPKPDVKDSPVFTNALEIWHTLVMTGGARNTPRVAKRFQNRVRYLAMRQRALQQKPIFSFGSLMLRKIYKFEDHAQPGLVALSGSHPLTEQQKGEIEGLRKLLEKEDGGETQSWEVRVGDGGISLLPKAQSAPGSAAHKPVELSAQQQEFRARVLDTLFVPEEFLVAFSALEDSRPAWIQDEQTFNAKVLHVSPPSPQDTEADRVLREAWKTPGWAKWQSELNYYRRAYLKLCTEISKQEDNKPEPPPPLKAAATSGS